MRVLRPLLFAAACLAPRLTLGVTLLVDPAGPIPTIQAAIDSASDRDTLLLAPAVYHENPLVVRKDLFVVSRAPGRATIDAGSNGLAAFRTVSSFVRFEGLILENGVAPFGAGVLQFGGRVELRRCLMEGNQVGAWAYRGSSDPGELQLEDCEVLSNGIGVEGAIATQIARTRIQYNRLGVRTTGYVELADVRIQNNGMPGLAGCGALALGGSQGSVVRCVVSDNYSDAGLGGIWASSGPFEFTDCEITRNRSLGGPAGLGIDLAIEVHIRHCKIADNHARGVLGGSAGLLATRSKVYVEDTEIERNDSGASGGGVAAGTGAEVHLDRCRIVANTTAVNGGGVYSGGAHVLLDQVALAGNSAISGGGIAVDQSGHIELRRSSLAANRATYAPGVMSLSGVAEIERSLIAFHADGAAVTCFGNTSLRCVDLYGNGSDAVCGQDLGGNLSVDPQFCGLHPETGQYDLRLSESSPVAVSTCGLLGAHATGCATTAVQTRSWTAVKRLYR